MTDRFFPIKTQTSCQLKWNWSTIRLYAGNTSSCHRVKSDPLTAETFGEFHNTAKKLADRELMLQGQWPTGGCEYCQNIEKVGGFSDRMFHLSVPEMYPPELDLDPNATYVSPQILEIYFDNTCNMSCIYCWEGFSSRIEQENKKFGRFEKNGVVIENLFSRNRDHDRLAQSFWDWLSLNHLSLKRLQILGGEPFFQIQFDQCLDFFDKHPSPQLEFSIITNLKIIPKKLHRFVRRLRRLVAEKKLKNLDITASIDCFGPEQEYVRYGIDLNQWRENFEFLVSHRWITLNINQTLSALTIKTVPDLLKFINLLRKKRPIGHYFSTVVETYDFLHPSIFGRGFFSNDFDAILNEMPGETWQQKQAREYMQGIKLQINSGTRDQSKIEQLAVYLDELDRRRGLSWRETFPWLVKEVTYVV